MQEDVPTRPVNTSPDEADPNETLWLVSYADDDDREMTAVQIFHAMRRGEIDDGTIVWRDGMPEWQAINEVPSLQRALEQVAGQSDVAGRNAPARYVDKKRTVLGGFRAHAGPPRPDSAPRNTLVGGHANEAASERARGLSHAQPTPGVGDLDDDLDEELLESVRPPVGEAAQRLASFPSQTETAPLPGVAKVFNRPPPSDGEAAPISLDPDSIESLPSNALESVVAELPPPQARSAPSNIFEVGESEPPVPSPDAETKPLETKARPRPPLRDRSVLPVPSASAEQEPDLAPYPPGERKGRAGSVFLVLLLLAAMGGVMFYVGQQTAKQQLASSEPSTSALAPPTNAPDDTASTGTASDTASADTASTGAGDTGSAGDTDSPGDTDSASQAAADEARSASDEPAAARPQRPSTASPAGAARPITQPRPAPNPVAAPKPAPEPTPEKGPEPGPFDTAAASAALTAAAQSASSCRKAGDPSGVANVTVTFATSGRAINANVHGPPFAGTTTGGCIASKMRSAKVPPFSGDRITVKKVVVIQ